MATWRAFRRLQRQTAPFIMRSRLARCQAPAVIEIPRLPGSLPPMGGTIADERDTVIVQPQISYRDVPPSPALDHLVQSEAAKLERFFGRILNCRVHIENIHRRRLRGSVFHVRIELSVPGEHLVVNHTDDTRPLSSGDYDFGRSGKPTERQAEHKDPQLAVRDAFRTATSRLQDYVRQRRDS